MLLAVCVAERPSKLHATLDIKSRVTQIAAIKRMGQKNDQRGLLRREKNGGGREEERLKGDRERKGDRKKENEKGRKEREEGR